MAVTGIVQIFGIDSNVAKVLAKENITTVKRLYDATRTKEQRDKLADKTGFPAKYIYYWSKQAELLRIDTMTPENAVELIYAGIRSIEDIIVLSAERLLQNIKKNNAFTLVTENMIDSWKRSKRKQADRFEPEPVDLCSVDRITDVGNPAAYTDEKNQEVQGGNTGVYSDLSDMICEIGSGIARAQAELDLSSMNVQNEIFSNPLLSSYGLNATWYAMPQIDFNLKMEYKFTESSTESGEISSRPLKRGKFKILPSNANYNNFFQTTRSEESSLNIKFVPVPVSERLTEYRLMPDLMGKTEEEAREILDREGILAEYEYIGSGNTANGRSSEVVGQSVKADETVLLKVMPRIMLIRNDMM